MQAECQEVWRQMALSEYGKNDAPNGVGDFGFIGPWQEVMKLCQDVVLSKYHVWPEAGGWFDQPEWFRHDFTIFMKGYAAALNTVKLENGSDQTAGGKDEDYEDIPSWREMA